MFTRNDRIRKTLIKEIGDIIQTQLKNPNLKGMISVIDLEVSKDNKRAKVYVSIFGADGEEEAVLKALQNCASFVRCEIGKRIRTRNTPEIFFKLDGSLERGSRVSALIDQISRGEEPQDT